MNQGENVSAVWNASVVESTADGDAPSAFEASIREGDWQAYRCQISDRLACERGTESFGTLQAYKRACALAYLGRRAQVKGGVCNSSRAHILTPRLIADLEHLNKTQRFARYPWLEAWMNILTEIERLQDEISTTTNVISLVQPFK
jgi:hypothetical protein